MIKKLGIFIIYLGILIQTAQSQQLNFRNYSLEDGLPQSEVTDILQDSRGYLWVATNGSGISRFNGKTFKDFSHIHKLGSNMVRDLEEDNQGRIWIATIKGLNIYDGKKLHTPADSFNLSETIISQLRKDREGNIWIIQYLNRKRANLFLYHTKKQRILAAHELFPDKIREGSSFHLFLDREKNLYIFTEGRIFRYKNNQLVKAERFDFLTKSDQKIFPYLEDSKGRIWMGRKDHVKYKQVYIHEKGKLRPFPLPVEINSPERLHFLEDQKGDIWISIFGTGLLHYHDDKLSVYNSRNYLPKNTVGKLLEDHENNLWLACFGQGLTRISSQPFTAYNKKAGLQHETIFTIYQDSQNRYWFGSDEGVISRMDDKNILKFQHKQLSHPVKMTEIGRDSMLIAAISGLFIFQNEEFSRVNEEYGLQEDAMISDMLVEEGIYYFATVDKGLIVYDSNTGIRYHQTFPELSHKQLLNLYKDSKNNLWIGTINQGILKVSLDPVVGQEANRQEGPFAYEFLNKIPGLNNQQIIEITEDDFGRLWIASFGGGLAYYDGERATAIDKKQGLSSGSVYSLLKDPKGNIWAGTQKGVDRISFDPNSGNISEIKSFGSFEGFSGIENNGKASYIDRQGNLWFGTIRGAMKYEGHEHIRNTIPPKVRLNNVKLFYKNVDWQKAEFREFNQGTTPFNQLPKQLKLPYNKNHLSFEFEGLSYKVPEKVRYRWKLEGLDEQWSPETFKTEAVYANLEPGRYRFLVEASNNDGVWSQKPFVFAFTILTPWWQTLWFKALMVLLLGALSYLFVRIRINNIKAKKKELEWMVEEKTSEVVRQKNELEKQAVALKAAYQSLKSANKAIVHKNDEIERKNQSLVELNKEKNYLIGIVAHDLRNPLTSAMTMTRLLNDDADSLNEEQAEITGHILRSIERMNNMITRILDIKTIEAQKVELEYEPVKLAGLVRSVGKQFEESLKNKHLTLLTDMEDVTIETDRNYSMQIIENLISNAIKFSPKGKEIRLSLKAEEDHMVFKVQDQGPGLTEEDQSKLFGKYQKLSAKPTAGEHSTGLGLSIVKKYIEAMKGKVYCESKTGEGATFIVEFPRN